MKSSILGFITAAAMMVGNAISPAPVQSSEPAPAPAPEQPPAAPSAEGTLVVVNQRGNSAYLISLKDGRVARRIDTGKGPHEAAVSPDGKTIAVTNYGGPQAGGPGNTLTLISLPDGVAREPVSIGDYSAPHGVVFLDNDRAVCTSERTKNVVIVNVSKRSVEKAISTDQAGTHMVCVPSDHRMAFTANVGSGSISALDLVSGKKLWDLPTGKGSEGIAVSPDGRRVWVGCRGDNSIAVVDTAAAKVVTNIPSDGLPYRLAFTPDAKRVVVPHPMAGDLAIFDAQGMKEIKRIHIAKGKVEFSSVGGDAAPLGIAVHPSGRYAYTTLANAAAVAVVDLKTMAVVGKYEAGDNPDGIAYSPINVSG